MCNVHRRDNDARRVDCRCRAIVERNRVKGGVAIEDSPFRSSPMTHIFEFNRLLRAERGGKFAYEIYLVLTLLGGAGRLHGSSRSHWLRRKTSSSPMKSMKDEPPHVEASVGPADVVNGQLQLIWNRNAVVSSRIMTRHKSTKCGFATLREGLCTLRQRVTLDGSN